MELINILRLVCILQGLTTGSFLLLSPGLNNARKWLALLMLIMSFAMLDQVVPLPISKQFISKPEMGQEHSCSFLN